MDEIALQFYLDDFRSRINGARQRLGVSTEQMCQALDITRQTLSNFENERGVFKLVNALAISTLFDFVTSVSGMPAGSLSEFAIAQLDYDDYIVAGGAEPVATSLGQSWHRKQFQRSAGMVPGLVIGEKEVKNLIVFVDIFSFLYSELADRFLWWMIRVSKHNAGDRVEMYIDNTISETQIITKVERAAHVLNAISDVKQQGLLSLHAMNLRGMEFLQGVRAAVALKGFDPEKCVVASANVWTLSGCERETPAVLLADGLLLGMAGMGNVMNRIIKDEEREMEANLAAIPAKLLMMSGAQM
ncbi:MAG: hypothetical protein LBC41_11295 [Clostridiales bacterium]|nr:hypothetical protein [Clostridiales bacterium]